ncbi:MAG TPA: diguanylate cyclase, partial [Gammaproteobacteria bacterium]|nr:diguanylate cyclase [Gammaproteobacteria bacterium]
MIPNKILTVFKTSCIGPLLSLLTVALLEVFTRTFFPIPNPPAILLITVVYSAFCGGVRPGLLSAAIAWLYFAWFFSIPGEPFYYTHDNLLRVLVWAVATPLIAVMTGLLKQRSQRAFELERANAVLEARIAEREQSERVLRDKESLLQTVLETLPVGVWLIDAKGLVTHGNQAVQSIWEGRRYIGIEQYHEYKGWWADTGKRINAEEWAAARAVTRGETSLNEVINIECFDGSRKTILNSAVPIRDAAQNIIGAVIVNQDITERRQTEERLAHLASYDTLTDLPNRTLFTDRLTQAMARTDRNESILALLLLDMDRFKEINDTFGHNVGDLLLRAAAGRLQQGLREVDTIARLGGDEFTMVLENIGAAETAVAVAKKVVDVFTQP